MTKKKKNVDYFIWLWGSLIAACILSAVLSYVWIAHLYSSDGRIATESRVIDFRIAPIQGYETQFGGGVVYRAEYKIEYWVHGQKYYVWANSGIKGQTPELLNLRLEKQKAPKFRVLYDPTLPGNSEARQY